MEKQEIENYRKAGKIAIEVKKYARTIIKKGVLLRDIADKIEAKIVELGGKPAFPTNLSMNEIAAHYTPNSQDETKTSGLLKVDLGVHVSGCIADTAFSLDLENSEENKKLIEAAEKALEAAKKTLKKNIAINLIGKAIHDAIVNSSFSPIRNLCGHQLGEYIIHAGLTIPNYDNKNPAEMEEGAYAIEPFSTTGAGIVYDGKPSGIYRMQERKAIRDPLARQIMDFVEDEYETLPFCERWITNKFGPRSSMSLRLMEQAGILHQYPQLIEQEHKPVAQAEDTVLILDKIEVTSR
jgi:methionyl aminopeptidase